MRDDVRRFIRREELLAPGEAAWVAVSGGSDSMVLLHVLRALGHPVHAAHVDHGLRGAESDADRALVERWCRELGVPCRTSRVDVHARAAEQGVSVQMAARALRIAWFESLSEEGPRAVALAHHRDDAIETMWINLLRGSAGAGRGGIAPRNGDRIRPLLCVDKAAILAYAQAHGVPFREDRSNRDPHYLRSRVRHELVPMLEALRPGSLRAMGRSQTWLRELEVAGRQHVDRALAGLPPVGSGTVLVPLERIRSSGTPLLLLHRLLAPLGAHPDVLERVADAIHDGSTGARFLLGGREVTVDRDDLVIAPPAPAPTGWRIDRVDAHPTGMPLRLSLLEAPPARPDMRPEVAWLDADRVSFPLELRRWTSGDRMRPAGLGGSKLVSDLLTDAKVPTHRRSHAWVLLSAGQVVWLVGRRLSEGVAATPASSRVLRAEWVGTV